LKIVFKRFQSETIVCEVELLQGPEPGSPSSKKCFKPVVTGSARGWFNSAPSDDEKKQRKKCYLAEKKVKAFKFLS
jgi:hypothetical protein